LLDAAAAGVLAVAVSAPTRLQFFMQDGATFTVPTLTALGL